MPSELQRHRTTTSVNRRIKSRIWRKNRGCIGRKPESIFESGAVRGMSLRKVSYEAFVFFCTFEKSGINEATDLAVSQLRGSTIAIISAHVPGPPMWESAGPGPSSSSPKQWKSDCRVKIYNSVSARAPLTKSKNRKNMESAGI